MRVDPTTGEILDHEPSGRAGAGEGRFLDIEELTAADEWDEAELAAAEAEEQRKAEARKAKASKATRPVAVTDRDMLILQFLARYRMATYPQIAAMVGSSYEALRQRMPRLAREGLVVRKNVGASSYSVWLPTDAGMRLSGMDLPTPVLSWGTVGHTLGLVDIGLRFEALGETVVTEREIRAADTRDRPTDRIASAMETLGIEGVESPHLYIVPMGKETTGQYSHIPDMVLVRPPATDGSPRSVAIELELNHKPLGQWKKILSAYQAAPHIGDVVYYTHTARIRNGLLTAAKDTGTSSMVKLRKFEPSKESAVPLPGK